jgi:hypothetical protein
MFLHTPLGLIQAIFDGMANTSEALKVGWIETKECGIFGRFDDQGVFEINHDISPYFPFKPAAFRIALQVPVGISFAPW